MSEPDPSYPAYPTYPAYPSGPPQPDYGYGPPAGAPKRATPRWLWVAIAVVVVAAVGLGTWFFTRDAHPEDAKTAGRSLDLPAGVDGYRQLTSFDTGTVKDRLVSQLGSGLGSSAGSAAENAKIGAYARTSTTTPELLFIGFHVKDVPNLQSQVEDVGVQAAVDQFTAGMGAGADKLGGSGNASMNPVDPGTLGGAMRCGQVTVTGRTLGLCGWGDRSYFALTLVSSPTSPAVTEKVARDLRAIAEH